MINYFYGETVDPMKNTVAYAKAQASSGKDHTIIDHVTTKFYYGRTFCTNGSITQWMRPVENEVVLSEPTWNDAKQAWVF